MLTTCDIILQSSFLVAETGIQGRALNATYINDL